MAAGVRFLILVLTLGAYSEGIVKLFENACGAVDVSGLGCERWWLTASFQAAAAVMIWFQTAKRLVISVRHSGALIR